MYQTTARNPGGLLGVGTEVDGSTDRKIRMSRWDQVGVVYISLVVEVVVEVVVIP